VPANGEPGLDAREQPPDLGLRRPLGEYTDVTLRRRMTEQDSPPRSHVDLDGLLPSPYEEQIVPGESAEKADGLHGERPGDDIASNNDEVNGLCRDLV
jgi:hypothetical protein